MRKLTCISKHWGAGCFELWWSISTYQRPSFRFITEVRKLSYVPRNATNLYRTVTFNHNWEKSNHHSTKGNTHTHAYGRSAQAYSGDIAGSGKKSSTLYPQNRPNATRNTALKNCDITSRSFRKAASRNYSQQANPLSTMVAHEYQGICPSQYQESPCKEIVGKKVVWQNQKRYVRKTSEKPSARLSPIRQCQSSTCEVCGWNCRICANGISSKSMSFNSFHSTKESFDIDDNATLSKLCDIKCGKWFNLYTYIVI